MAKAKAATGFTFAPIPDHISAMFAAFDKCGGWIREPVGPDQWTLALISKFPPRHGWNTKSASFHRIDSEAGQATIKRLTSTKKELNNERDSGNQQNAA